MTDLLATLKAVVDRTASTWEALAVELHDNPEIAFEEHRARRTVTAALQDAGFVVAPGPATLPTSFIATYGDGPQTVAFCVEYDALPLIGHGCGHHLIAAASSLIDNCTLAICVRCASRSAINSASCGGGV